MWGCFSLFGPQRPPLQNGANHSPSLAGLGDSSQETLDMKTLAQCQA